QFQRFLAAQSVPTVRADAFAQAQAEEEGRDRLSTTERGALAGWLRSRLSLSAADLSLPGPFARDLGKGDPKAWRGAIGEHYARHRWGGRPAEDLNRRAWTDYQAPLKEGGYATRRGNFPLFDLGWSPSGPVESVKTSIQASQARRLAAAWR